MRRQAGERRTKTRRSWRVTLQTRLVTEKQVPPLLQEKRRFPTVILAMQYNVEKSEISIWELISICLVNDLQIHPFPKQREFRAVREDFGMNSCVGWVALVFAGNTQLL